MRSVLLALALAFAAPAFADTPIKFPEKVQRTDFQMVIADVGPAYVAGQPTEAAFREMVTKECIKTIINLRTQHEMDNRRQVPFDGVAPHRVVVDDHHSDAGALSLSHPRTLTGRSGRDGAPAGRCPRRSRRARPRR